MTGVAQRSDRLVIEAVEEALHDRGVARVGDVMTGDPLVVAPEDTIGEVAERMSFLDVGAALVAEYGRLIGILTSRDMLRALAGRVHSSEARVRQWMTADPIVVSPATDRSRRHGSSWSSTTSTTFRSSTANDPSAWSGCGTSCERSPYR